jgi:hypothetical protein
MMLALLGASTYPAMAQDDATPAASPARQGASNPIDPTVGDSVSLTDARGEEYALATVTEVIRPWEDYSEFEEPDRGTEYVGIVLEVENTSDDPVEVDPFDFLLQDAGGFSFGTAFAQGAEELEMAPLTEATEVEGGETGEFLLVFNVFEDQGLAHLFWQPETGRLITLAQLEDE